MRFPRLHTLFVGHSANALIVYGGDYVLYPFVIFWLGLLRGFLAMSAVSFIVCWATVCFYDWSQRDWLGIEVIKEMKHYDGPKRSARVLAWVLRMSDPLACVLLSIKFDPFIVTIYLRRGRFGGMTPSDWRNFLLSWLIGNAYWSVLCFTGLSIVEGAWTWIKGAL